MLRKKFAVLLGVTLLFGLNQTVIAQAPEKKSDEIKLELLDKGKAPHRQLRFTPKAGDKTSVVMDMKMSQKLIMAGLPAQNQDLPGQQMFIDVETKKVDSNGDIDFAYTYKDIKIVSETKSPVATMTERMMKPLIGASGSGTMSSRGVAKKGDFNTPEGLDPMSKGLIDGLKDSMSKASTPLPEEPVGVGAKWKFVQEMNSNGIQLTQTTVTEVTEITSSGFSVKSTVTQAANAQEVKNAMLPPGASMKLDNLKTEGSGKSNFVFGSLFPVNSSMKLNSKTAMKISVAGQNQEMSTDMDMEMTIKEGAK